MLLCIYDDLGVVGSVVWAVLLLILCSATVVNSASTGAVAVVAGLTLASDIPHCLQTWKLAGREQIVGRLFPLSLRSGYVNGLLVRPQTVVVATGIYRFPPRLGRLLYPPPVKIVGKNSFTGDQLVKP